MKSSDMSTLEHLEAIWRHNDAMSGMLEDVLQNMFCSSSATENMIIKVPQKILM